MASPARFSIVRKQLETVGYRLVRISSSHHIFEKRGSPIVVIPVHRGKVQPAYVREVRKIVAAEQAKGAAGKAGEAAEGESQSG